MCKIKDIYYYFCNTPHSIIKNILIDCYERCHHEPLQQSEIFLEVEDMDDDNELEFKISRYEGSMKVFLFSVFKYKGEYYSIKNDLNVDSTDCADILASCVRRHKLGIITAS
jgi:hypothetical protein